MRTDFDIAVARHVAAGEHVLADLRGVSADKLCDAAAIVKIMRAAAAAAGATVLGAHFHHFGDTGGVTGVLLLAESHASIHTWPEAGYAAVDVFMCGEAQAERALASLVASFAPTQLQVHRVVRRGAPEE